MQSTLPGMHTSFQPRKAGTGVCERCGSKIKLRFPGQTLGPVCMRKMGLVPVSITPTESNRTTTKPKRLIMPDTKPYARIQGNKCDRHPRCDREATLSVGEHGQWRLCDQCAIRHEFDSFGKRVPLKEARNV
jgi:hypothetical protein